MFSVDKAASGPDSSWATTSRTRTSAWRRSSPTRRVISVHAASSPSTTAGGPRPLVVRVGHGAVDRQHHPWFLSRSTRSTSSRCSSSSTSRAAATSSAPRSATSSRSPSPASSPRTSCRSRATARRSASALGLVGPQKPLSSRCLQRCLGSKFFATATEGAALVSPKGLLFKVFCYGPGMDGFQKAFVASGHTNLQEVLPKLKIPC